MKPLIDEKIDKLTLEQIKKREKDAETGLIISLIAFPVSVFALYLLKVEWIAATIPLLAPATIAVRVRRQIFQVLIARIEKQKVEK